MCDRYIKNEQLHLNQVHLWYACPHAVEPARLAEQLPILSKEERQQYGAFRFDADRHHYLAAHLLLRHALCRFVNRAPGDLNFARAAYGKPYLSEPRLVRPLEFNLTHSHGLVACAIAGFPVGIDAEWRARQIDPAIAASILAPYELQELNSCGAGQRPRRLMEYWTLKEAFVKATGKGLAQPLDRFWFRLDNNEPRICFAPGETHQSQHWQFTLLNGLFANHLLAVAVARGAGANLSVEVQHLSL